MDQIQLCSRPLRATCIIAWWFNDDWCVRCLSVVQFIGLNNSKKLIVKSQVKSEVEVWVRYHKIHLSAALHIENREIIICDMRNIWRDVYKTSNLWFLLAASKIRLSFYLAAGMRPSCKRMPMKLCMMGWSPWCTCNLVIPLFDRQTDRHGMGQSLSQEHHPTIL